MQYSAYRSDTPWLNREGYNQSGPIKASIKEYKISYSRMTKHSNRTFTKCTVMSVTHSHVYCSSHRSSHLLDLYTSHTLLRRLLLVTRTQHMPPGEVAISRGKWREDKIWKWKGSTQDYCLLKSHIKRTQRLLRKGGIAVNLQLLLVVARLCKSWSWKCC